MGDKSEVDAERDRNEWLGVGDEGCEGGNGLIDASSSAPVHLVDESSTSTIVRGREASLLSDGVRDRDKYEADRDPTVESRCAGGTGIDGYGLLAMRLRSLSAEFTDVAYDME